MSKTKVVCLKRSKGEIIVDCDVYIGRRMTMGGWNLPQSEWANQFKGSNAVYSYYKWLMADEQKELRERGKKKLKGKTLGCWCLGKKRDWVSCHGEVWQYVCDGVVPEELKQALSEHEEDTSELEAAKVNWELRLKKIVPLSVDDRIVGMFNAGFMGDALGMFYEFGSAKNNPFHKKITTGLAKKSRYDQTVRHFAPGQVTDDSEMALILTQHLVDTKGKLDASVLAQEYIAWANSHQNFMGRNTRDLFQGISTLKGYQKRYEEKFGFAPPLNEEPTLTSEAAESQLSNGSLMRCMALALLPHNGYIYRDVYLTNPSVAAEDMECDYLDAIRMALKGESAADILAFFFRENSKRSPEYTSIISDLQEGVVRTLCTVKKNGKLIEGKGSIMSAMYSTLWCLMYYVNGKKMSADEDEETKTVTYLDMMESLVVDFPGSDTDTNGIIMSALLGAIIGNSKLEEDKIFKHNRKLIYTYPQESDLPRPLKYHPALMYTLFPKLFKLYTKLN